MHGNVVLVFLMFKLTITQLKGREELLVVDLKVSKQLETQVLKIWLVL